MPIVVSHYRPETVPEGLGAVVLMPTWLNCNLEQQLLTHGTSTGRIKSSRQVDVRFRVSEFNRSISTMDRISFEI